MGLHSYAKKVAEKKGHRCPQCGSAVSPPAADAKSKSFFPFCCERCQLLDLGKWAAEEYKIPDKDQKESQNSDEDLSEN